MGSDERELGRKRTEDEPDVEGHMHRKPLNEEPKTDPEDRERDEPDVEAHMHRKP